MASNATTTDTVTVITAIIQMLLAEIPTTHSSPTSRGPGFYLRGTQRTDRGVVTLSVITEPDARDYLTIGAKDDETGQLLTLTAWRDGKGNVELTSHCRESWLDTANAIGKVFS